jgi:hypothetical protein
VKQGPELLVGLQVLALTGVEISSNKGAACFIGADVEKSQVPLQEGQFVPFLFSSYFVVAEAVVWWGLSRWKCQNPSNIYQRVAFCNVFGLYSFNIPSFETRSFNFCR